QALRRDRQSIRRRWLGAGAVAASVALGVFGAWQPWAGPELCHGAQQRLQGVWDMPRQQAVEQALTATGFAYGEQSWSLVDEGISAYTKSWAQTYEQACTVHHRGETSAELYDRQMECLDRRLTEVDALVDILADADAMVLQQTSELIAGLQPVATCGDTESLRESYAPPSNQKTADAVRNLRSELVRIRLRADAGHADKVVEAAEGAVRAARTLGYRPVIAEALFQLGFVRMGLMQEQETQDAFLDAFLTADAVRHDQIAAEAGAWLVFLNARRGREVEAKLRAEHVEAVIARYGHASIADVNLHRGLATVHFYAGRFSEARDGLQHALAIAESLPDGQGELFATRIHINIGQVCEYQGDADCMSRNYERAMDGVKKRLGPENPGLTMYRYMLAKARLHQGRFDEAQDLVVSSLTTIRRTFGEEHHLYARCLNFAAEVSMLRGDLDVARTYSKQAIEITDELFAGANPLHTWGTVLGAKILGARGEFSQALELANVGRDAIVQASDEDAEGAGKLHLIQAQALLSMEKNAEAIQSFERFLAEADRSDIGDRLHRSTAYVGLARAYTRSGNDAHAHKMLAEADRLLVTMGDDHWAWAEPLEARAELAMAQGRIDEAIDAAERMMTLLRRSGCSRIEIPRARFVLARAVALRDPSFAIKLASQAQAEAKELVGADPKTLSEIEAWLRDHAVNPKT
ncbi:MAG: tetratricopeptide repeat protein, partial [Nannocystaceae bacterium]